MTFNKFKRFVVFFFVQAVYYRDSETSVEMWLDQGVYQGGLFKGQPHGRGTMLFHEEVDTLKKSLSKLARYATLIAPCMVMEVNV